MTIARLNSRIETSSKDTMDRVRVGLIDLLYKQILFSAMSEAVAALLVVMALWKTADHLLICIWFAFNVIFSAGYRAVTIPLYNRRDVDKNNSDKWLTIFLIGTFFTGISWGIIGSFFMPANDVGLQAFIIAVMCGVSAAANVMYSPLRRVYTLFLMSSMMPLAIWLILQEQQPVKLIGIGIVVFIFVMLMLSKHLHTFMSDSLRLRFENDELTEAKLQLEALMQDLFVEIKQRKKIEDMLEHLATHDVLTDLPNRALFQLHLKDAFSRVDHSKGLLAVLFLDLDNFKRINDTMGHDLGDDLLNEVGYRLKGKLRDTDIIARLGGDEFTLIIEGSLTEQNIISIADELRDILADKFHIAGHDLYITASIGISFYPKDGQDIQTLIKNADIALYHAKACGKNNCQIYTKELDDSMLHKQRIEEDLRKAIEQEHFALYYQPLVELKTGKIVGKEALLRWQHPELGIVSPTSFIDIAEEVELIVPITKWVIREVCRQHKAWEQAGVSLTRTAINISSRLFRESDFVGSVVTILQETGVSGQYIDFEITESLLIQDTEATIEQLRALRALGIKISLDDFGTGYSSLNYLKRFPFDIIKIDRFFIKGIPQDAGDKAIASAVITLGRSLNLTVLAEGIETKEQLDFICSQQCDIVQGFLVSQPIPADKYREFCINWRGSHIGL